MLERKVTKEVHRGADHRITHVVEVHEVFDEDDEVNDLSAGSTPDDDPPLPEDDGDPVIYLEPEDVEGE